MGPLIEGGTLKRFLWAPVLVLVLAGCGGVQKDATYESASKLRDAVIASGVECPGDASDKSGSGDEDFLKCSGELGLHVFRTDDAMVTGKIMTGFTKTPSLQGPRWLIQSEDAAALAKLRDKLGGSVVVP